MPATNLNQGHYDPLLTGISVAYMQQSAGFIAQQVFPVVPVPLQAAQYVKYPRGNFFRNDVGPRPMGGKARRTSFAKGFDNYSAEERALAAIIDDRERANQVAPFDSERSKVQLITSQMMIDQDQLWAAKYWNTGIWGTDLTGVTSAPGATNVIYWNLSTSDPVKDIRKLRRQVKAATGFEPNLMVIGSDVEVALLDNAAVINRISGGASTVDPAFVDLQFLERAFSMKVLSATGIYNSADEGQTETMSFIVGTKNVLLAYVPPAPAMDTPSAGYTFAWTGYLGASAFGGQVQVNRYREAEEHSDVFEVQRAYDMKVVASDLGVFISGAVQ